ncbi:hypothetical protein V8C43DRAFT_91600 [Trichoderma afarasin]
MQIMMSVPVSPTAEPHSQRHDSINIRQFILATCTIYPMPSVNLRWVSRTCYPSAYRLRIVTMVAEGASTAPSLFDLILRPPPCPFTLAFPNRCSYSRNKNLLSCFFYDFSCASMQPTRWQDGGVSLSLFDCAHKYINRHIDACNPCRRWSLVFPVPHVSCPPDSRADRDQLVVCS